MSETFLPPLPPFHVYRDFLDEGQEAALLEWGLANEGRYSPTALTGGVVDPGRRKSELLLDMGPAKAWFEDKVRGLAPNLFAAVGVAPFEIEYLELEIVAHGDGAHFATHTDIPIGWGREPVGGDKSGKQDRLLSAVYYFHREPKGFSGGELRLHRFGGGSGGGDYVDVEPVRNSLVVFPSWAEHEVRTVHCPSGRFEDYRFAVNIWLCKTL